MADFISYTFLKEPVILVYPGLFEARAYSPDGKPAADAKKYFRVSLGLRPGHPDFDGFWAECNKAAQAAWPGQSDYNSFVTWPIASGAAKAADLARKQKDGADFNRFEWVVNTLTGEGNPPSLAVFQNGSSVNVTPQNQSMLKNAFYGGVHGLVKVNLKGSLISGNYMVLAYLQSVMSLNEGDRVLSFGGGTKPAASEEFKGYKGHVSGISPSGGTVVALPPRPLAPGAF